MTRLEKQILEKEQELENLKKFAFEMQDVFSNQLNKIIEILRKYKTGVVEPYKNSFVDYGLIDKTPIFRVYLSVDLSKLSQRQKNNLESNLRSEGIPMPICPISNSSISLVYSKEKYNGK